MNYKKWLKDSSLLIIFLMLIVVSLMYWSDTYSVSHTKRTLFYTEPNTRVLRVDYILNNKDKYDSFVFGSSRVGAINSTKIKNGNYYNMTYSEGIPHEHLLNIKLFLKYDIKIKNLLIGIDDFSYKVSFLKHQQQGLTKSHYLATNTNKLIYFKDNFIRFPLGEDRSHIKKKLLNSKNIFSLDVSKQIEQYLNKKVDIKDYNSSGYLNNVIFDKPTQYVGDLIEKTIGDINEINKICLSNNINCKFFINPIHKTTYSYLDIVQLNKFKKRLSQIIEYYDFSYYKNISENNFYWHETSHYRDIVGDLIIDRIYNNKNIGFGKKIDNNIILDIIQDENNIKKETKN